MKLVLLMAITLDGKIAKHSNQLANWTSKADKKMFVAETKKAGVIVMGENTYNTIGKPLPDRLNIVLSQEPEKKENIPGSLEFIKATPKEIVALLEKRGFETAILGGGATVNGSFLKENLIDEIWLTIEPKIFGDGLSLFNGADVDLNLELISTATKIEENVLQVRYRVIK
ncbi:MAG: dihydrofolate reductase family protein [Patescibacteria group bacterium]|nr:dihydrofolate reductase family protein [Patescibacteria group bacterium]